MDKVIPTNGTSAEDVKYANIVKKVYIDGVDVSECEYNKGYCRISALCDYTGHICEVNNNCYYKQLMRARAEIEELKDNKAIIKVLDNEIKISNKLKQCLKEIKEILWQQINERGCAEIREDKILDKISEVME